MNLVTDKHDPLTHFPNIVSVGNFYEPSLLPDHTSQKLNLTRDKLVQHDISDLEGKLIPAWQISEGLRPGTVICAKVTLHVYNIPNQDFPGFRRVRDLSHDTPSIKKS